MRYDRGFYSFEKCKAEVKAIQNPKLAYDLSNKLKAFCIEQFYSGRFRMSELSRATGVSIHKMEKLLNLYRVSPTVERFTITRKSKV